MKIELATVYQRDDGDHDATDTFYNCGFDDVTSRTWAVAHILPHVQDDESAELAKQALGVSGKDVPTWLFNDAYTMMKAMFMAGTDPEALKVHFLGHIPDMPPHG